MTDKGIMLSLNHRVVFMNVHVTICWKSIIS